MTGQAVNRHFGKYFDCGEVFPLQMVTGIGFSREEMKGSLVDNEAERWADMYNFVVKKIEEVQMKIRDLKRIEQVLQFYMNVRLLKH